MNIHYLTSTSFSNEKISSRIYESSSHYLWAKLSLWHQEKNTIFLKSRIAYCSSFQHSQRRQEWVQKSLKISATKGKEYFANAKSEEQITQKFDKKKGTVAGAVALIIGTSIGSGILALPQKTSPAGIIPSSIAMTMCWAFLLVEALVLVEINVGLLKKNSVKFEGGTKATDQVNQCLTALMIGLLVVIEVLASVYGGWSEDAGNSDWGKVPPTIPVLIFSLVYHDLAPVLCAYLEGDLKRIRASVLIGGLVPLLALLIWDAIAFGLSSQLDQVADPVELLLRLKWSGLSYMVQAFSLLAVGTSLIGTLLSFSEFLKEQINKLDLQPDVSTRLDLQRSNSQLRLSKWWRRNNLGFTATAIAIAPPLLVSTTIPDDAFSAATDIAGGYCMTMLYGVLPPAMAWAMHNREGKDNEKIISRATPVLLSIGLISCGIIVVQILQDLSILHS
ncbi:PREDICTED: uncharacterized protein LOC109227215 isoform X5 [Nicotiana attenuata]|uniref:uncharacterized protein LOC109227215 isoform X5 n=1 Tax=Nicotiana attenuata TaxID=49451 RepID=UPI00090470EC|nr:PREDICTED: uncharacterized protein LOC109227215 isoform X5 [Nicotiana attenuata]